MESFTWNEKLKIGVESVDKQHMTILTYLEKSYNLVSERSSNVIVKELLDEMRAHSQTHFTFEENLMLINNHPTIYNHVKQHEIFIEKIDNCKYSCITREMGVMQKELLEMKAWLMNHILEFDKLYLEHFYI